MDFWNRVQPNELKTRVWFWELEYNQLQTLILHAQITPERPQIILDVSSPSEHRPQTPAYASTQ